MRKLLTFLISAGIYPAAPISLFFSPSAAEESMPGSQVAVDLMISGTAVGDEPSIGSLLLTVNFNPAVLSLAGVEFGSFLGEIPAEALAEAVPGISSVELAQVSLLAPSELDTLQPEEFRLATLRFDIHDFGVSPLTISDVLIDDAFGFKLDVENQHGSIAAIPEPCVFWLMPPALAGMLCIGRRHRRGDAVARHRRSDSYSGPVATNRSSHSMPN